MVEKIGTIKNPLTIIAIFAGIAEISGTIVLPFISEANQSHYIWFLMIFPVTLVILFFLTLNFNRDVLYAPSDFKNEENFFKSVRSASLSERIEKLSNEVREIAQMPPTPPSLAQDVATQTPATQGVRPSSIDAPPFPSPKVSQRDLRARYLLAEELVLNKVASETDGEFRRNVTIRHPHNGSSYVFDGMVRTGNRLGHVLTLIEVKYFQDWSQLHSRVTESLTKIRGVLDKSGISEGRVSVLLALATDSNLDMPGAKRWLDAHTATLPFAVNIRFFNLDELEKDLGQPA